MKAQLAETGEQKGLEPSNDTNLNDRFSRRRNDAALKGQPFREPGIDTDLRSPHSC